MFMKEFMGFCPAGERGEGSETFPGHLPGPQSQSFHVV